MNADLAQRAVVATDQAPWVERDGYREIVLEHAGARRTSVVELPAGGRLPVAVTTGTMDVLVLDGELDGAPDRPRRRYAAGTFLHTPPGWASHPDREWVAVRGCRLLVKHRPVPMLPATRAFELARMRFRDSRPGVETAPLYEDFHGLGHAVLLRFARGATIGTHRHDEGEELFVLRGELRDEYGTYGKHTWVRQPPGSEHAIVAPEGALTLTYAQHLV